ncbi:hypothetical protein LSH36_215g01045 [Paralvinella palmiformis]|uniref:Ubiquitin-like domain-containing protein n=1 Tax=Paralvinella palmiformis TaxID=53620 RepID=A0AAD9JNH5_9ANNE|nr:hypothetical protein LSH36_215g01045 [Paralvinella palmiformis]
MCDIEEEDDDDWCFTASFVHKNVITNPSGAPSGYGKQNSFEIRVKIDPTGEAYPLEISNEMKIEELMSQLEFLTGIPIHIQKLWYLDEGDLQPDTDVRQNSIVPDGLLHVTVRYTWYKIIDSVYNDDIDLLMTQGVTPDSHFTSPNLDYLARWHPKERREAINDRSLVALYMAAHRGRLNIVNRLLEAGSEVNGMTPNGRTALHVAASRGHGDVMDTLLEHGATPDVVDMDGETPSSIAIKHGHKDCDRHLFMFRWQQRAKNRLKQNMSKNG